MSRHLLPMTACLGLSGFAFAVLGQHGHAAAAPTGYDPARARKECEQVQLAALFQRLDRAAAKNRSETGQSAFGWLGARGKIVASQDIAQIVVAAFFISRPHRIASWVLRHAPAIREPAPEPFDPLLRRARELGLRQAARPDIVTHLVGRLALHPEVLDRFPELEALLRYGPNPMTRSVAARAIVEVGPGAAVRVRDTAARQLAEEVVPEVVEDLKALVALAERQE